MKNKNTTVKITLTAIFAALALAFSFVETLITAAFPLPMGVKPGLSNIIVMFVCFSMGLPQALSIAVIKAGFNLLLSGASSGFISLFGGVFSVLIMFFAGKISKNKLSYMGISVLSAVMHNLGQLTAATLLIGSSLYLTYAPVLLITGVIFGIVTGILLNFIMPSLKKLTKL